jgi:hypothetical protein
MLRGFENNEGDMIEHNGKHSCFDIRGNMVLTGDAIPANKC